MSLNTGRAKLFQAMKTLRVHWESVQEVWNDPVRHDFEENFWNALDPQVQSTLRAIDRLAPELIQFKQDCS